MTSSKQLQNKFKLALLNETIPSDMHKYFHHNSDEEFSKRFSVYRNNVMSSLKGALASTYPIIYKLIGDEAFLVLANAYNRQHPPIQSAMVLFGETLPGFIKTFSPLSSLPYLYDVAKLELAWHRAYHAADAAAFNPQQLSTLSEDEFDHITFQLHPSVHLIHSPWPIITIWKNNQSNATSDIINLDEHQDCYALVHRPQLETRVTPITKNTFELLSILKSSATLAQAYEKISENSPNFNLGEELSKLFVYSVFIDFDLQGAKS